MTSNISRRRTARSLVALALAMVLFAITSPLEASLGSPYVRVRFRNVVVKLTTYGGTPCTPYKQGNVPETADVFSGDSYSPFSRYTLTCGSIRIENKFTVVGSTTENLAGAPTDITVRNRINFFKKVNGTWTYQTYKNPSILKSAITYTGVRASWWTSPTSLSASYDGGRAVIEFDFEHYDF